MLFNKPAPPAKNAWPLLFVCWLIAAVSTLGAIFLGEVMGLTPCVLCWYQRICMFPLVFILAAGLFPPDRRVVRYALPLALTGLGFAVFHLLVAEGFVAEALTPCSPGVPCSQQLIVWFGFLTIPMLSVAAFSLVNALLVAIYLKAPQ
ncbi:MAG: disulfide bond formation protein B [Azonexus sp.]|jgi:disulfide bond formation protein DsbB|nr:disulfide bond formation protein B [Azonexus sp.]